MITTTKRKEHFWKKEFKKSVKEMEKPHKRTKSEQEESGGEDDALKGEEQKHHVPGEREKSSEGERR